MRRRTPRRRGADFPSGVFNFNDLLAALGLFLVIEGMAPFLNPSGLKRALLRLVEIGDRELRIAGLGSMLVGVIILFLVR